MKTLSGGPARSRTRRRLDGKEVDVGVAGRILTEWCGERPAPSWDLDMEVETEPLELVEEALLWLWWWAWCMERIEETEDDVDFRPRRPVGPEERRTVDLGVTGEGERECRLYDAAMAVCIRGSWLGLDGVERLVEAGLCTAPEPWAAAEGGLFK